MKLAPYLSRYLYSHKKLSLAGIGKFDFTGEVDPENDTRALQGYIINFHSNPNEKDDDELIAFISSETGKMKALAASDLHSYVELAMELLNIGKPFHIDGIGTLLKTRGEYSFIAEAQHGEKEKRSQNRELSATSSTEESFTGYEDIIHKNRGEVNIGKRILIPLLVLAGTLLAIWGGYTVYKRSAEKNEMAKSSEQNIPEDTLSRRTTIATPDTVQKNRDIPEGHYKFIYETTNSKRRALSRYEVVSKINPRIRMETKDSLTFRIYTILPATPADTARIKEELNAWYYGNKPMMIRVEY